MAVGTGHLSFAARGDERKVSSRAGASDGTRLKERGVTETEFKHN